MAEAKAPQEKQAEKVARVAVVIVIGDCSECSAGVWPCLWLEQGLVPGVEPLADLCSECCGWLLLPLSQPGRQGDTDLTGGDQGKCALGCGDGSPDMLPPLRRARPALGKRGWYR